MPQQAKAGQVGAGGGAKFAQALGTFSVGQHHGLQRRVDPAALGSEAGVCGKQRAGANGLGQYQHIAGLHAALAHHAHQVFVNQAIDGKAQRQLTAFTRVATHQRAAGVVEHLHRTGHHLKQQVFHLGLQAGGHRGNSRGRLRLAAHGKNITQRMVGRHFAKQVGVVHKGPEEVHRMHQCLARRHAHNRGVVGVVQANEHVVALHHLQLAKRP